MPKILNKKDIDFLCVGAVYLDINSINVPFADCLRRETETVGDEYEFAVGGSAVNFSRSASSLGLKSMFIGKIGKDWPGKIVKKLLTAAEIEFDLFEEDKVQTNLGQNFVNKEGRTIMVVAGSANQNLKFEEIYEKVKFNIPRSKYLYAGSLVKAKELSANFFEVIKIAKKHDVKVILDHGRIGNNVTQQEIEKFKKIISEVDYYLPSENEFQQIFPANSLGSSIKCFQKVSRAELVVKRSEKGALSIENGRLIKIPAFPVDPVNTVGAGDSFNVGFVFARNKGKALPDSIISGCGMAALKIAQKAAPNFIDLENFLKDNKTKY